MDRRRFLLCGVLSLVAPGCLDAPSATEDDTDSRELQQAYVIQLEPAEDGIDKNEDVCQFAELTEATQREIERAIDQEEYHIEETPELMKRNCHNGYIEYESEYYWLRITIESG